MDLTFCAFWKVEKHFNPTAGGKGKAKIAEKDRRHSMGARVTV